MFKNAPVYTSYKVDVVLFLFSVKSPLIEGFCLAEKKQDLSLSISTNGPASISVSVEVNGVIYSGESGNPLLKGSFVNMGTADIIKG